MKRLFTLAVVALIATMAFAQSQPAQRRVAYTTVQHAMQVGQLGPKAYADALAKADAAKEFGSTRLVRATNPAAGYQQLSKNGGNELGQLSLNDDRVLTGTKVSKPVSNAPYKAPAKVTETEGNLTITKDAHGIITNVEGVEPQIYTRANTGIAYYSSNGSMAMAAQSGNATIIVDGNNVYMLNPISRYTQGTWVKGVKNGNTITVATKQPLAYNTNYGTTISLRWGVITAAGNINNADSHADAFTFTINGDVITLEGTQAYDQTADAYYMGTFWDDDNTAAGYGDAETVLTLNSNYTPPSTELVTLPAGVTAEGWYLSGTKVNSSAQTPVTNQNVKVAFTGNDVYVQGLFTAFPNSWVKGTKNGNTYEFANFQFLGTYGTNNLNIWAVGYDGSALSGYKATYNATAKTLTFNMAVLANAAEDRVYYLDWLQDVVISAEAEETPELVTPPAGVTAESWYLNGTQVDSENLTPVTNQNVKVAFTGNDVYVQGLFTDFPTSWIKGTKSGNNYVFANLQYVGDFSSYNIFVVGLTENGDEVSLTDFSAAYNASAKTLTFDRPILANASKTEIYYLDWIQDVVISAEAGEEPLLNTQTATLPYVNTFDTPEEQAQVAIYDANGDNKTFTFDKDTSTGSTVAKYTYSSSNTANDYMVFPAVQLKAGKTYVISLEARANGTTYEEKVSVLCGPDSRISSMTTEVIPVTTLNKTEYVTLTNSEFTVTETGMYNFAIKACSDPDKFYLYVDNFSIKEINDNAPAAPTDVVVTPDATGANKATVTLTAPSKNLVGTPLTGVLNMVIKVDGEQAVAKQVTTGAAVNEEITVEAPGFYNVTVEFSCAAGVADPVTVKAYIGIDVPAEPDNFTLVDKNTSIAMSWTAPQEGVNGAPFFPEDLVYNIYPVEMVEFWGMVFPSIDYDNPYATGVSGTSYDLEYNTNEGQQAYTFFGLAAENVAGEGEGIYKAMLTGAPYTLPVKESLAGGSLGYWWGSDCDNNNYSLEGGLYAGDNASDGDGYCLEFQGMTKGWVFLKSGKIALAGAANPVYQFDAVKTLGTVTLDVYVETSEGKTKVKTIEPTDEYATYTVSLADYKDAVWVSVILQANFEGYADQSGNPIAIVDVDNIQIYNQLDHNLAVVGINAPAKVTAGNDVVAKVTVENQGSLDVAAADYTVKFIVNGEEHVVAGVDIASNEKVEFEYSFPTNAASPAAYAIKAEVVYAADEDKANNTSAEINVVVAQPNYPTVANVAAAVEGNAVTLTWDEPNLEDIAPEAVTEDFESYEPFQFGDAIGEWTLVDLDGTAMGGMQNTDVPNLTIGETTGSYFVLNRETISTHESFDAKSGVQYLSTMFSVEEGNTKLHDWLISPALPGIAQTISFFAKSYSGEYPETFQVLYSTTDMATASFKKISGMVDITAPEAWTEYSYNLPEGAKYFAIRCTSDDKFMLFVDDITYIPANGAADLEIVGYNVYRDGVKVNAEPVAEATFTDADLAANTTYTFAVSVVYTQGESKTVAVEVTTAAAELTTIEPNVYYNLQILDTDPELFLSAGWQDDKQQVNTLEKDEAGYEQAFKFVPVADKDDVYNIVGADGKVIYASGGWDCFWNDAATETNFADAAYQFSVEPQNGYIYIKTKNGYIGSDGIWNWSKVWTDKGTDKAVKFSPIKNDNVNGINAIETEEDVVYYSIQGIRLANPVIGQPCIRVANGKATKVIIR